MYDESRQDDQRFRKDGTEYGVIKRMEGVEPQTRRWLVLTKEKRQSTDRSALGDRFARWVSEAMMVSWKERPRNGGKDQGSVGS